MATFKPLLLLTLSLSLLAFSATEKLESTTHTSKLADVSESSEPTKETNEWEPTGRGDQKKTKSGRSEKEVKGKGGKEDENLGFPYILDSVQILDDSYDEAVDQELAFKESWNQKDSDFYEEMEENDKIAERTERKSAEMKSTESTEPYSRKLNLGKL